VEELLAEAAKDIVLKEQQEEAILDERLADADRGDFLSGEEMELRVKRMLRR
jgi:predicted transcriptional regulator